MNEPATESAVHTTPPMMRAANIPPGPFKPTATITTEAKMRVINVMPETGVLPTIAMALAATVVKRKAITATSRMAITAKSKLPSITPNQKKRKVTRMQTSEPMPMILNEMSRWVRFTYASTPLFPFNSLAAKPTAPLMIPQLLMMPMIPAMAMPPIPMLRA